MERPFAGDGIFGSDDRPSPKASWIVLVDLLSIVYQRPRHSLRCSRKLDPAAAATTQGHYGHCPGNRSERQSSS